MAQAQQNPQTVQAPAEDENHIIAERRAKLAALRAAGVPGLACNAPATSCSSRTSSR